MATGLYLHIPFCARKCAYCDFASYAGREDSFHSVMEAMKAEMARAQGLSIQTVFFGGGTPTVLPTDMLLALLESARKHFQIAPDAEITTEANPGTTAPDALKALRAAGFNRLSLGAQAMQPHLLAALGRIHRWADVEDAVSAAREAGFDNISLDLMYGLPGQTPADFRDTLAAALALTVPHLSLYSLIVEEGTPFAERYPGGQGLPPEESVWRMGDDALWMTQDAGLYRYEISSYAKPGYACRHNLVYWNREDYLGIGCGAHSLLHNHRWGNARDIEGYLRGEREEEIIVSESEARFERLMLGLRLVDGIPWGEQGLFDEYRERLEKLRARGLVDWDAQRVWPTGRGLDLQNRIVLELMESP